MRVNNRRFGLFLRILEIDHWNAVILAVEDKVLIGVGQRRDVRGIFDEQLLLVLH